MESSISHTVYNAGQELASVTSSNIGSLLNEVLNRFLGWPFRVARGFASDSEGLQTDIFSTLVYTTSQSSSSAEPLNVHADTLACVIDVTESIDVEHLRSAYERIACAKRLRKAKAPQVPGVPVTTITLGIIFARDAVVTIEKLAEELDSLNRQHPDREWTDMVVVLSKGTINYVVQFPGGKVEGDFLPPAEGALAAYIPPTYVIMFIRPTGAFTFNKMCAFLLAHLAIFSPGAKLPNWAEVLEGTPKKGMTLCGYQYNLSGQLVPVPRQFYNDRYIPPRPLRIEDRHGSLLATMEFLPWQDGGVVLLRGKLPLDGLLIFLGKSALDRGGIIRLPDVQISYVLRITRADFEVMVQRIQKQTNMIVRVDQTKLIVQKLADEGSSSPFVARLLMGILRLRDMVFPDDLKRREFDKAYDFVIMTLLNTRTALQEILRMLAEHIQKVSQGEIARLRGQTIQIDVTIDTILWKESADFLNNAVRALKHGMQTVTTVLQVNIGFLFQKSNSFDKGLTALEKSSPLLAAYLRETRKWSELLIDSRIALEHAGWMLPRIKYLEASGAIRVEEPQISGEPVSEFVQYMMDRISCFVEEVTTHCFQAQMPAGFTVTEIPLAQRDPEIPERFQLTLANGGMPIWNIMYHQSAFQET